MTVACRYSSSLWADAGAPSNRTITAAAASLSSFRREPPPVVIRRIAVHGVDMQGGIAAQALRSVLDDKLRTLNPVIGRNVSARSNGCWTLHANHIAQDDGDL